MSTATRYRVLAYPRGQRDDRAYLSQWQPLDEIYGEWCHNVRQAQSWGRSEAVSVASQLRCILQRLDYSPIIEVRPASGGMGIDLPRGVALGGVDSGC